MFASMYVSSLLMSHFLSYIIHILFLELIRDYYLNFLTFRNRNKIYFLQDTYFTEDDVNMVRSKWGFEIFISPGKDRLQRSGNITYNVKIVLNMKSFK